MEATLRQLPGVEVMAVDARKKRALLLYDGSRVTLDQIKKALARAGFPGKEE